MSASTKRGFKTLVAREILAPSGVVVSSWGPRDACARIASVKLVPGCAFDPGAFRPPADAESPTVGVGHNFAAIASGVPHPAPLFFFRSACLAIQTAASSPSDATDASGVGQNEDPLSAVRRSNVGRSKHAPFRIEPHAGQAPENDVNASNKQGSDVLHEDEPGSHLANDPHVLAPEPGPRAIDDAGSRSGAADVLAGESANDEIHASTPRAAVEGGHVRPDRRLIQPTVRHARDQYRRSVSFPLHVADRSSDSSVPEPKVEPSDAGEETDGT